MIDPRAPPLDAMVHCGNSAHPSLYKTLALLKIESVTGPVWFAVEGLANYPIEPEYSSLLESVWYFYDEHSCPTNYVKVAMISHNGDHDPHGVFDLVDVVWMTTEYGKEVEINGVWHDEDGWIVAAFPQLSQVRPMSARDAEEASA